MNEHVRVLTVTTQNTTSHRIYPFAVVVAFFLYSFLVCHVVISQDMPVEGTQLTRLTHRLSHDSKLNRCVLRSLNFSRGTLLLSFLKEEEENEMMLI